MQYHQEKLNPGKKLISTADLSLEIEDDTIIYKGTFFMDFKRGTASDGVTFKHELYINRGNGEFIISHEIINKKKNKNKPKSVSVIKRSNFDNLSHLTQMGFYRGEKRRGFWGVKYERITSEFFGEIISTLRGEMDDPYLKNKTYYKPMVNRLFDFLVDYHLCKKKIKGHDNVYLHIKSVYPKKKWLKLNNNKFLPAILEEHGVKSKYLVKELSIKEKQVNVPFDAVNIKAVIYMCGLFGKNYVEHIKKFDWRLIANEEFNRIKKHECKNDAEKRAIIKMFEEQIKINLSPPPGNDIPRVHNILLSLHKLMEARRYLEQHGYDNLKLSQLRTPDEIELVLPCWELLKKHLRLGYMVKYKIPQEVVENIELPIKNGYFPKVLLSDHDFCYEGVTMKNCMGQQFIHGAIYIFISLSNGKQKIDLQYQKGNLHQSFGKANSPVPTEFKKPIEILSKKMKQYKTLKWEKEKVEL